MVTQYPSIGLEWLYNPRRKLNNVCVGCKQSYDQHTEVMHLDKAFSTEGVLGGLMAHDALARKKK